VNVIFQKFSKPFLYRMIVVSDHKMVKEMFSKSVFSGRLDLTFADFFMDGNLHGN